MLVELTEEEKIRVLCSEDLYEIMRRILFREGRIGRNREHFWAIGLSDEYVLLFVELVALGSSSRIVISPREVFQLAVHKSSTYVVLSHNHPGSFLQPSDADLDFTDKLIHAAEILNLEVIEHLIINENSYFSFKDKGLIEKLGLNKKYAVGYIEVERIHGEGKEEGLKEGLKEGKREGLVEGVEIGKYKGLKEGLIKGIERGKEEGLKEGKVEGLKEGKREGKEEKALEMANAMKQKGLNLQMIKEISGLSIEEIEKL